MEKTRDEIKNKLLNKWMKLGRCFDEAEILAEEELEISYDIDVEIDVMERENNNVPF